MGVLPPYRSGVVADPGWMVAFAADAEAAGMESLYLVEHVVIASGYEEIYPYSDSGRMPLPEDCPIPDPLELIAFLAAGTTSLRFGTGILVGPHHHPLVLAKRLGTLDALSRGRVSVGIGVGWMREEIEATGADFGTRGSRTEELIVATRAALTDDPAGFDGEFFSFDGMRVHPRPSSPLRIHVGGHSEAAARRAGRCGDGLHPLGLDDDGLARRWELVRRTAEEAGRDPAALELTVTVPLGSVDRVLVERFAEIGAQRIVCSTAATERDRLVEEMAAAVAASPS